MSDGVAWAPALDDASNDLLASQLAAWAANNANMEQLQGETGIQPEDGTVQDGSDQDLDDEMKDARSQAVYFFGNLLRRDQVPLYHLRPVGDPDTTQLYPKAMTRLERANRPTDDQVAKATSILKDWLTEVAMSDSSASGNQSRNEGDGLPCSVDWDDVLLSHGGNSKRQELLASVMKADLADIFYMSVSGKHMPPCLPKEVHEFFTSLMTRHILEVEKLLRQEDEVHNELTDTASQPLRIESRKEKLDRTLKSTLFKTVEDCFSIDYIEDIGLARKRFGWDQITSTLKGSTPLEQLRYSWAWSCAVYRTLKHLGADSSTFRPELRRFRKVLDESDATQNHQGLMQSVKEALANLEDLLSQKQDENTFILAMASAWGSDPIDDAMEVVTNALCPEDWIQPMTRNLSKFLTILGVRQEEPRYELILQAPQNTSLPIDGE